MGPGIVARALGTLALANAVFVVLVLAAPGNPDAMMERVRAAFASGDLGMSDYLPGDVRRGWHQYNDCNVLQMLANRDPSRIRRALAPTVYYLDPSFAVACPALHAVAVERANTDTLRSLRYTRYWHGYNVPAALGLRVVDLRMLRAAFAMSVWIAIAILAIAARRSTPRVRHLGLAIAASAALLWAVPFFSPNITHAPGDVVLLLGIAGIAAYPRMGVDPQRFVPYATLFGAVVAFFEMLTGQLPIGAAWIFAVTLAAGRDAGQPDSRPARVSALAAAFAFTAAAVATIVAKQAIAAAMGADPDVASVFAEKARHYSGIPATDGTYPGALLPFVQLMRHAHVLTYGNGLAGKAMLVTLGIAWTAAVALAWRHRRTPVGPDAWLILAAALAPIAWTLLLPRHTFIHASFMIRMSVITISLTAAALLWLRRPSSTASGPAHPA